MQSSSTTLVCNVCVCFYNQQSIYSFQVIVQNSIMQFESFYKYSVKNILYYLTSRAEKIVWNKIFTLSNIFNKPFGSKIFCETLLDKTQFVIGEASYHSKLTCLSTVQDVWRMLQIISISNLQEPFDFVGGEPTTLMLQSSLSLYAQLSLHPCYRFGAVHLVLFVEVNITFLLRKILE
jgi:hypothetical protein